MGSVTQSPRTAFRVLTDDVDRRVDRVVRRLLPRLPLSRLYQALREGDIRVNGARVTPATRTRTADLICVDRALAATGGAARPARGRPARGRPARGRPATGRPAAPPLAVLYRDADILVVDKPAGLAVHGEDDSVMARLAQYPLPRRPALSFAAAPVHQLDRVTSGALVVALTLAAARSWSAALRSGMVVKLYLAVVAGDLRTPPGGAPWEDRLLYDRRVRRARGDPAGAIARARVWSVARAAGAPAARRPATLLLVRLHTGRRHQIRAQAAARGHALLGDLRYAAVARGAPRHATAAGRDAAWPLLHAAAIGSGELTHAGAIVAPLPARARLAIERHFGPGSARRAGAAVTRQLGARPPAAGAHSGSAGEFGHG